MGMIGLLYRANAKVGGIYRSMLRRALLCASMLRLMATCSAICDMLALAAIQRCSEASTRSKIRDSKILMESGTAHLPLLAAGVRAFLMILWERPSLSAASAR